MTIDSSGTVGYFFKPQENLTGSGTHAPVPGLWPPLYDAPGFQGLKIVSNGRIGSELALGATVVLYSF